ncbi:MAG: SufD family Fe-S cluster assembly protein [Candidatus Omnitrophota bacterium]
MKENKLNQQVNSEDTEIVTSSGMDLGEKERAGSFFQQDNEIRFTRSLLNGVDILGTQEALKQYPEFREYLGKNFRLLGKAYPQDTEGGYFIRVKKGQTVALPVQTCLFLKARGFNQKVHNLIIVEEGAKVYLITGCSASKAAHEAFHLGISEFFLQKNSYLNFTMIHSWKEDISVKPMSIAVLDEGATFISNYVCLKPVKEIVMYPTAILRGQGARASFNSLILSHPGSLQDIGSRVVCQAENTQAEIISRAVSLGGKIIARGHLKAENKNTKAHLECHGLILSEKGCISAIPELETDYRDVDLSHEAAIGKIRKEEIDYLCARGFSEEQAQSVIIRGFMDVDILGLPELLRKEIDELEQKTLKGSL